MFQTNLLDFYDISCQWGEFRHVFFYIICIRETMSEIYVLPWCACVCIGALMARNILQQNIWFASIALYFRSIITFYFLFKKYWITNPFYVLTITHSCSLYQTMQTKIIWLTEFFLVFFGDNKWWQHHSHVEISKRKRKSVLYWQDCKVIGW